MCTEIYAVGSIYLSSSGGFSSTCINLPANTIRRKKCILQRHCTVAEE